MKLTRHKIRKLHKQKNQSLKRIKDGSKPKHHKKHNNNTFRQKNRVDDSDSNKNIARFRLSHLFNKTLKSYIPAKELARINKKYKENRYQRRIRKMIPYGKRTGIMTGGADEPRAAPPGWELLYDPQSRPYYGNPTLKITQYEYPEVLPPGWEVLYDHNGQPYYGNKTLNITQWEFPSPATPGQQSPATPGQQSPATPGLSPATNTILPKKEEIKEVDARDSLGNWYKAYIIKHFKFDVVPELPEMLKVHFVGWGVGNDENIPVVKEAERIRSRTPDAKTGQLIDQKDNTIDGVIALYTEIEMTRSKEKAEAEAREFKQDQPTGATAPPMEDEGGEDSEDGEDGEDGEGGEEKKDEAAEVKPAGKCNDKIKTPYAQTITLQVKADDDGEMSVTVDPPVSTGIDGLPGILNRGQQPPAGGQQPPVTPGTGTPGTGNSAATVGGARHTRRKKYAKRGNKRKMTITRK